MKMILDLLLWMICSTQQTIETQRLGKENAKETKLVVVFS